MKNLLKIIFISFLLIIPKSYSKTVQELHDDGIKALQEGGKIVFLRHAYIKQSKIIGEFIVEKNINIEKVIVSPTCRTYKTAKYAGWEYTISKDLKNTSDKKLQEKRFKKIKEIVSNWEGKGNLILVTHFQIINPTFPGVKADSGEMIVVSKDMIVLGRIKFPYDITIKD